MANVGAGVFQGMPVSTSLSASSLNESSGARTPVASLVTGALVLATLIVLAPLFSDLPKAVLAAIIIDAVVFGMIDIAELRRLYRVTRFDFWIAVAAIVGVLSAGVLAGVVIGVVLSLGWLIYVATQPSMPLLGREPDTQVFRDLDENPDDETFAGIVVLRLDGGLFFATAEALENRIRDLVDATRRCARSCSTSRASTSSTRRARRSSRRSASSSRPDDIGLRLARVKPHVLAVLRRRRDRRPDRRRPHPRQRPPRRPRRAGRGHSPPRGVAPAGVAIAAPGAGARALRIGVVPPRMPVMIRILRDMPPGVLGFEAVDDVEKDDYEHVIVSAVETAIAKHGKVRLVYVLGPEFDDYEGEAVWEDLKLGARHPASFERVAVVTDARWAVRR